MSNEDARADDRAHTRLWELYDGQGWHVQTFYAKPADGAFDQQYPGNYVVEFVQSSKLQAYRSLAADFVAWHEVVAYSDFDKHEAAHAALVKRAEELK